MKLDPVETTQKQIKTIIDTTSEQVISEKFNKYFINNLDELRILICELYDNNPSKYAPYKVNINDYEFWDYTDLSPSEAIEAVGSYYKYEDNYTYKDDNGLYESFNDLSDFYSDQDVKDISIITAHLIKTDPIKSIKSLFYPDTTDLIIKILK